MLALLLLWTVFVVCAGLSVASAPWVVWRQRRRTDDLASFASFVAAGPGMLLLVGWLLHQQPWWTLEGDVIWPLYALELLWGTLWLVGGPWLLARCYRHRAGERRSFLLDVMRVLHACCWLSFSALPLVAALTWMLGDYHL